MFFVAVSTAFDVDFSERSPQKPLCLHRRTPDSLLCVIGTETPLKSEDHKCYSLSSRCCRDLSTSGMLLCTQRSMTPHIVTLAETSCVGTGLAGIAVHDQSHVETSGDMALGPPYIHAD